MLSSEMRKYINILSESRQEKDGISYEIEGPTKKATAAGEFSKITATLSGPESAKFTRLAKKYKILDMIAKRAAERRDTLNEETREKVQGLFDVEDAVLTRYVETVSLSITLAKATEASTSETRTIDIDGLLAELYETVDEKLIPVIKELEEKYTKIGTKTTKASPGALRVKIKEDLSLDGLESYAEQFKLTIMPILDQVSKKLSQIESQIS